MNINAIWATLIVEELVRNGVTHFCIAPGSRSSALTMAVAQHKGATAVVHIDERGCAFYALGHAVATKKPVVLICTSGTAGANYFPAVIEASKKKLPLIIITADRPPELRQTGAMQTIDQVGLFGKYVKYQVDCPCPTQDIKPEYVLTTIDQAVYQATRRVAGPVHLNCMFREPLSPMVADGINLKKYCATLVSWEQSTKPYTTYTQQHAFGFINDIDVIATELLGIKNGIIVVGKCATAQEAKLVLNFARALQWPIFADGASGLRLGERDDQVIHYFDQLLLNDDVVKKIKIDGVLHLGGRITSKRYYQLIEKKRPKNYIMVLNHPLRHDPLHTVTRRIEASISHFCDSLMPYVSECKPSAQLDWLKKVNQRVRNIIQTELTTKRCVEACVARIITQLIPDGEGLMVSNSMPVRLVDMYGDESGNKIIINGNRGASGIDGIVATSIGFANGLGKRVTTLIGDVAMLHDLNSLAIIKQVSMPIIVVVINNDGGEIFEHLPIARQNKYFEQYFATPHGLTFDIAAKMFGMTYAKTSSALGFGEIYRKSLRSKKSTLIEVTINRRQNMVEIKKLMEKIKRGI